MNEFKQKLVAIVKKLGVPVQAFVAIQSGHLRKPLTGMWQQLQENYNDDVMLQLDKCFYVGDAAGRPELGKGATKRRKDHSLADRLFAHNIGISFYTPEEHFLDAKKETWIPQDFDPSKADDDSVPQLIPHDVKIPADKAEIIIMVGLPGSGKFSLQILGRFLLNRSAETPRSMFIPEK